MNHLEAVVTDSRADLVGALFVPLVGERFDGHRFLEGALRQGGAGAALAQRDRLPESEARALAEGCGRPIWLVDDTLEAYQQLGRLWRRSLAVPVVAVTGSAGKTTTRELIRAALAPLGPVVASRGNENNDIGAPLTLLRARPGTAALVVEMGMRGPGEIDRLSRCAEPDVAVITAWGVGRRSPPPSARSPPRWRRGACWWCRPGIPCWRRP
jgi:UDP-N-acetylmuramoyl-tripeptide--D-alanyl-D-alanine ligase